MSEQQLKKLQIELLEIEILDLKGQILKRATKSYRRLLKDTDEPIYLTRMDE